jgi:hypothetical protein
LPAQSESRGLAAEQIGPPHAEVGFEGEANGSEQAAFKKGKKTAIEHDDEEDERISWLRFY